MSGPSVKIPADWLDSVETEAMGSDALGLLLSGLGYSARQTTDGLVPRSVLRKLWPVDELDDAVDRIIKAGEAEDHGDQLLFVKWRQFILTKDEVDEIKAGSRERSERSRRHKRGDHSMCRPNYCNAARSRDKSRDHDGTVRVSDGHPYRPVPDRPLGREGRGGGAGHGSAGATPRPAPEDTQPHDYVWPDGTDADTYDIDEEPPCVCGAAYANKVHSAHPFDEDPERPGACIECGGPELGIDDHIWAAGWGD